MENTTKSSINILFSWLRSWSQVPYFLTMISEKQKKKQKKTVKLLFSFPHGMQDDEISGYSFHKQNIFSNYFIFKNYSYFCLGGLLSNHLIPRLYGRILSADKYLQKLCAKFWKYLSPAWFFWIRNCTVFGFYDIINKVEQKWWPPWLTDGKNFF